MVMYAYILIARKSAMSYLPVQVFSQPPSDSADNTEHELDLDLDNGQTEPNHNPGPRSATHSRRIAILEINDSSSSQDSEKPVYQRDADDQSKNMSSGHAINILSDSDLESSPSLVHVDPPRRKSRVQRKIAPSIVPPRLKSRSVPQNYQKDKSPSTPDPKLSTKSNDQDSSDDESPMFISPIGALEIINKYPARNMKEVRKVHFISGPQLM